MKEAKKPQKINYGPYEYQCKGGIPSNAVTRVDEKGDLLVIYIPTEKGEVLHAATERYALGEGGRGSGKSKWLRMDAHLRNIMIPGHRALLLRRTFPQLRNSHFAETVKEAIQFGPQICPKPFNETKFQLEYSNGSLLKFGHCQDDNAINDYLSQEWDWIGFDELTTFTFNQFIRISLSSRSPKGSNKLSLIRGATNPVGEGAAWVKRYFLDKNITKEENPRYRPEDWLSVKMNVVDNPFMDSDAYTQDLQMLPSESLRRAYIDGEWLVEGQFFSEWRETGPDGKAWHVVQEMPLLDGVPIVEVPWIEITRCIDWGYSEAEPGYCAWIAHLPDGTSLVFKEWVFTQRIPEKAAEIIKEKSRGMKIRRTIGDPMMWQERTGKSIAQHFAPNGVSMYPADNDRENGWVALHTWLVSVYNDGTGERPRMQFLAPQLGEGGYGAPYAIRTLPSLQTKPEKPSDITQGSGVEDHAADALRYWASNWPAPTREPRKDKWMPKELREAIYGGRSEGRGIQDIEASLR